MGATCIEEGPNEGSLAEITSSRRQSVSPGLGGTAQCLFRGVDALTCTGQLLPPKPTDQGKFKGERKKNRAKMQLLLWLLPSFALVGAALVSGEGVELLFP